VRTESDASDLKLTDRTGLHLVLLVLITSLVYSNTLYNTYHLDSVFRVAQNTEIETFWPPARFFTDVRTGSSIPQIAEYRPMMPLSHSINNEIARVTGTNLLAGYHLGNILIHIGSAIVVYFLFRLLIFNWGSLPPTGSRDIDCRLPAFAGALIFAMHPISGSAVNYIAARDLLLMVLFLTSSMLVYMHMRSRGDTLSGWLISLILLCLAILSKQGAIVAFGLVFLFEWLLMGQRLTSRGLWARTLAFSLPTAAFFISRALWISKQNFEPPLRLPGDLFYPLTMAKAHVFYYGKNIVWPFEMRALAQFDRVENWFDMGATIGVLFILSTLALAWLMRRKRPLIAFAILAYWLFFALTASIFPFRYIVTDYRQYMPLIFLSLFLALLLFSVQKRSLSLGILAVLTAYFSAASYYMNRHWKTEESFWYQSVKYGATALAHNNYARQISRKDPAEAEQHFLEALRQSPNHVYASINLGLFYIKQGRPKEGLALLKRTAHLNPRWALAQYWLAQGLYELNRNDEALAALMQAANLDRRRLQYQYDAAEALQRAGREVESVTYLERITAINPGFQQALFLLGWAHQKQGNRPQAIDEYEQFLKIQPGHVEARFNLAYSLMQESQYEAAVAQFEAVLKLQPEYREAHNHLANCYEALGNRDLAEKHRALYREAPPSAGEPAPGDREPDISI